MMAKYKIIDWRLRPPFGSFGENQIFWDPTFKNTPLYPESARQFSMEMLFEEMEKDGVVLGVVPFRKNQDATQEAEIKEMKTKYPGKFKYMAHIDPYADDPVGLIDHLIINGDADLAVIEPSQYFIKKSVPADDKLLYPIYEKCQKDNIPLTIAFGGLYTNDIGFYDPAIIDHVANDFPDLKMVLAHGGWPYAAQIAHVAYRHANLYLSPDCYLTTLHPGYQDFVIAANHILSNQFIFGSVYPGYSIEVTVNEYLKNGLSEEVLPKVFYENAAKVLGLEA